MLLILKDVVHAKTKLVGILSNANELHYMNFLAHAYLSFSQPEILVGNMISDFVKASKSSPIAQAYRKALCCTAT